MSLRKIQERKTFPPSDSGISEPTSAGQNHGTSQAHARPFLAGLANPSMNLSLRFLSCSLFIGVGFPLSIQTVAGEQNAKAETSSEVEAATRLQVFLDRANFGPGKIDGHYGGFTEKALILYREVKGLSPVNADTGDKKVEEGSSKDQSKTEKTQSKSKGKEKDEEKPAKDPNGKRPLPELDDMDLSSVGNVFIDYQVTEADIKSAGELPKTIPEMAKLKWLPYATVAEAIAEKFHSDLDFLKELNPGKLESLKAGDTVKVPNVEPFDIASVKDLPLLDQLAMSRDEADKKSDDAGKTGKKAKDKDPSEAKKGNEAEANEKPEAGHIIQAAQIAVKVGTQDSMVRLFENGKLVAAYPVTIGSEQTKSPQGEWKVRGIARLPDFRYDKSFLKTGERGDETYLLQPGPNNLVGVIWIATNKRGIGLHGTSEPDTIGRSTSHGCVRLANWDIVRLATRVRAGVAISIH